MQELNNLSESVKILATIVYITMPITIYVIGLVINKILNTILDHKKGKKQDGTTGK